MVAEFRMIFGPYDEIKVVCDLVAADKEQLAFGMKEWSNSP
ncbi:MAG: hypothetical protein ACRDFQ_05410 [Anaerolineales bacterium]